MKVLLADALRDNDSVPTDARQKSSMTDLETLARNILRGQSADLAQLEELARDLINARNFGYARKILAFARNLPEADAQPDLRLRLAQKHALCTYKDPELSADFRLNRAIEILGEVENLSTTDNQETLGLAGAILKRKWELGAQRQHLEGSLAYYLRGSGVGVANDFGYTAINAAFVLDLLAKEESGEAKKAGMVSDTAAARRRQAQDIRSEITLTLLAMIDKPEFEWLENEWWFLVTIAEAYFGLKRYRDAGIWLVKAQPLIDSGQVKEWEYESTARQLATLVRLQEEEAGATVDFEQSEAWSVLMEFMRGNDAAVRSAFAGKVGLALSGGGFRASLFHIGVLAKLAELDMLRHIEVLSCVSGGSIIGAHYYLEVKKLLETKSDGEITRENYIEIVKRIERDFLAGVQRNIRTRVTASFLANIKMIFNRNYSRTERVGELYEEEIFSRIEDDNGKRPRWMNNLYINPKGEAEGFRPKYDNWRRSAKAPILVLNATTLNTGHNWQFTASWMGEPPARHENEVDRNYRLPWLHYWQAPDGFKDIRLGHAVAASSCVPGLFDPLVLDGLYEGKETDGSANKITVRLVDGGVHDNQGVAALLDQDCAVMLVSDASGQMNPQDDPSASLLGVPLRSNSILQARIREAQFLDLTARQRSSLLRGLMFIHLRKDLPIEQIDWIGCDEPREEEEKNGAGPLTPYHIRQDIQRLLSAVRTDLDSFSDTEAFALMTSGYRMTEREFPRRISGFQAPQRESGGWRFLSVEAPMTQEAAGGNRYDNLVSLLEVAHSSAFKIWKTLPALRHLSLIILVALLAALVWALWDYRSVTLLTVGMIGAAIITIGAFAIFSKVVMRKARLREAIARIGLGLLMAIFGWAAARIHLLVFDPLFLRRGRIKDASGVMSDSDNKDKRTRSASAAK